MLPRRHVRRLLAASLAALFVYVGSAEGKPPEIRVERDAARLGLLSIDGGDVALCSDGGGFRAYDATNRDHIGFSSGTVRKAEGKSVFDCEECGIRLHAEFTPKDEFVLVTGELENLCRDERGLILDYCVPVRTDGAVFSSGMQDPTAVTGSTREEANAFPIGALCTEAIGVAMAIPPSEPRIFGMAGGPEGLSTRFYLGLSPDTTNFPNRASFAFIIYSVEPDWGFRSALDRYYSFYPDYYTPRIEADGFWLKKIPEKVPSNVDQYGIKKVNPNRLTEDSFAPYKKHGILTYAYLLAGVKNIDLSHLSPDAVARFLKRPDWAKEYDTSACQWADGARVAIPRSDAESVYAFKMNPNPDLFKDTHSRCVGSMAVETIGERFDTYPQLDMAFLDSLGSRWPAVLNYRRDHFRYARYPLTVDREGRVALHNQLSHTELVERLREIVRARGKFLFANGLYTYSSSAGGYRRYPEHYRGKTKLGRFFMAARLDCAGCEAGVKLTAEKCQDMRALMGRKYYSVLNYHWTDAGPVEDFINKCLCYAVFGTNIRKTDPQYVDNPDGYWRDKALLDWFIPLVRLLHRAGWEPVTCAHVDGERVFLERFGSKDAVYFSLITESDHTEDCVLTIDFESLGFEPGEFSIGEIARGLPLESRGPGKVALRLEPLRTCIIALTKEQPFRSCLQ